ncbi:hypothetical protein ACRAJ3_09780 [Rhodococcus pyridinivorans]|uniref:hypothetical protein n=1 Tax=Rhodococcus pyridinivorans TaxID=103816 RepID=UPI003D7FA5B2
MNQRDELEAELNDYLTGYLEAAESTTPADILAESLADWLHDEGWRKHHTITTIRELAGMPDGTVIIGPDGLVGEKRDWPLDLAVRYVNGTQEANADIPLPVTAIHTPAVNPPLVNRGGSHG